MENNNTSLQGFALSPVQAAVWDVAQVQPGNAAATIRLNGTIDIPRFQQALNELAAKQEVLALQLQMSAALQYPLQAPVNNTIPVEVYTAANADKAPEEWNHFQQLWLQQPVTARNQFLWSNLLFQVDTREWEWCIKAHPVLLDGASFSLLLQQLLAIYQQTPVVETEAPITYINYAGWQNGLLQNPEPEAVRFWNGFGNELFNKSLVPLERNTGNAPAIKCRSVYVQGAYTQALEARATTNGVTVANLLAALFMRFLSGFENPENVVLGWRYFGRLYAELAATAGNMTKLLPLVMPTATLKNGNAFATLQQQVEELSDWADYYSLANAGKAREERFAYAFDFIPAEQYNTMGAVITAAINDIRLFPEAALLHLVCQQKPAGIQFDFYYNESRYNVAIINAVTNQWKKFLGKFVALLPENDVPHVVKGRDAWTSQVQPVTVLQQLRTQVQLQPQALALVYKNTRLTYAQVEERTNALAALLQQRYQIQPGDRVAILLNRSEWLPLSIWAVLKAGAAYVPVDTTYPDQRIEQILHASEAKLVISEQAVWEGKKALAASGEVLLTDTLTAADVSNVIQPVEDNLAALAYIIFTSGSTGKPKGVMINHESLTGYIQWCRQYYLQPGEQDNWALFTSVAFDLTVTSIFTPLCNGQTVYIGDSDKPVHVLLHEFVDASSSTAVEILKVTPSHVAMLKGAPITATRVKKIIIGGEALEWEHIHILRNLNPDMRIYNEYGPTEATVGCIVQEIKDTDYRILIGEPVANTEVCILNNELNTVEAGCTGELYLGGKCLALGYWGQPELTAERFVHLPWDQDNRTWYKTGDLVRQDADGVFDYLGRADLQIKIRGYRVEPGDIQAALLALPGIRLAHVGLVKEGENSFLAAYIQAETPQDTTALSHQLAARLPAYMVPSQYVFLDALPLTPNGKVDDKTLEKLALEQRKQAERPYVAPASLLEEKLQQLWQDILNIPRISTADDFFLLGGNSLNFSQLILRIHQQLGMKVNFAQFFNYTTLLAQAGYIAQLDAHTASHTGEVIAVVPEAADYPVTPAQKSIWKASQVQLGSIAYHMPGVLELKGEVNIAALQQAAQQLLQRHDSLRTVFRTNAAGEVRQVILPANSLPLVLQYENRQQDKLNNVLQSLLLEEIRAPFQLANDPLVRLKLWQTEAQEYLMVYTIHHLVGDGWSMKVFFDELLLIYQAIIQNTAALPALAWQYKDYTNWLLQQLDSAEGAVARQYWLQQFEEAPQVLNLATDFIRPSQKNYLGHTMHFAFTAEETVVLYKLAETYSGTLFMSLLTLLNALFYKYTGQHDIVIGSPIAGRSRVEWEPQIGLYANTLALRNRFDGEADVAELYSIVRRNTLDAYSYQLYPFDYLLEQLNLPYDPSRSPLFDVMIVLQNAAYQPKARQLPSLLVDRYKADLSSSKYDFCFFFIEHENALHLNIEYDTALFKEKTVQGLFDNLRFLLTQLAENKQLDDLYLQVSQEEEDEINNFLLKMDLHRGS